MAKKANIFSEHYEKVVLLVSIVLVILAVLAYISKGSKLQDEKRSFQYKLDNLKPENPEYKEMSMVAYSNAFQRISRPGDVVVIPSDTPKYFVPEARVWCANSKCQHPIDPAAEECPDCHTKQTITTTIDVSADTDGDGIPDAWEKQYGLNPQDPADAVLDADGDGFSNIEEYTLATDPTDKKSFTPEVKFVRLVDIKAVSVPIVFMSASRMPNGEYRCLFNFYSVLDPETGRYVDNGTTITVRNAGEQLVNAQAKVDSGFKFVKHEIKKEPRPSRLNPGQMKETDVHYATVEKDGETYTLEMGKPATDSRQTANLIDSRNDKAYKGLQAGNKISLADGSTFSIIKVDKNAENVVLSNDANFDEIVTISQGDAVIKTVKINK